VSLVALGQDADSRCEFDVDCRQPVARQRLHLLVLSPGGKDADGLKAQVLRAVGARPDAGRLRTPAFAEVRSYRPLVGAEVGLVRVYSELYAVRSAIERARVSAPMNDVVLIYYQGGETIDDRGNVFRTTGGAGQAVPDDLGIPCDKLVDFLADTPGAHLLLLDVERQPLPGGVRAKDLRDKIAHWEDYYPEAEAQFSVLRYVWREKADPPPPPQAHLLAAVGSILPHAARLSDLLRLLDDRVAAGKNAALLIYTKYAPPDLEELLVGAAP
ncbi:MAG TPA: hypothetical protein VJ739_07965, partial [Gemmataceae bacterium]|nr:hypothetical protein [Gemmataceae bacterium]